jgi:hypothetical protein
MTLKFATFAEPAHCEHSEALSCRGSRGLDAAGTFAANPRSRTLGVLL